METNFGKWLKQTLSERGINQSELARRIGVQPPQISHLISGDRGTTPENLYAIATALGVPPEEVFRAAVGLPVKTEQTKRIKRMVHLASELPEEEQAYIIEVIESRRRIVEQKAKYETDRKTRVRAASSEGD